MSIKPVEVTLAQLPSTRFEFAPGGWLTEPGIYCANTTGLNGEPVSFVAEDPQVAIAEGISRALLSAPDGEVLFVNKALAEKVALQRRILGLNVRDQ